MKLTLLIGIPGSGKSTYARRHRLRAISLDAIRRELYGDERILGSSAQVDRLMRERLRALAAVGKNAVVDATHVSRKRRERMIRLGRTLGYDRIVGMWFNTPVGECARRNRLRRNPVPDFVVFKMNRDLQRQPPSAEEGFDELIEISE